MPERWEQIERLYHAALEREPSARAAFLAEACAGDEELRREVASLLAYDNQPASFIEAPALEVAARELAAESLFTASTRSPAHVPSQLGGYHILSLLGRGGMGEVWLARDPRLGRQVAIKLLPAEFTQDAERVRRFEQEARTASSLNHPNIITIHEIGEVEGQRYLVTEYIEGETLRQRIEHAPQRRMRLTEALEMAAQIASALEAAHNAGIIHRDIKPENVMVRKDGLVKVLDFGLAKLTERAAAVVDAETPTRERVSTEAGAIMGTVAYMSPEQARGLKLDHRTDIFSLGVILYEMMAGRRPFEGQTASDLIAAVLTSDPIPLAQAAPEISPALQRIVMRCLEKQMEKRFQSAGDLSFALEALSSPSDSRAGVAAAALSGAAASGRGPTRRRRLSQGSMAWIVAGVLALAVIWLAVAYFKRPAAEVKAGRFPIPLPEGITQAGYPAISPDGRHLAFTATTKGGPLLWVRPLDSLTAKALPGTEDADSPFWSPDSQFIGFFAEGKLKKIAVADGASTTLCEATGVGGTWGRNGVILFTSYQGSEINRVSEGGGLPTVVMRPNSSRQEIYHLGPYFLPDGQHFVFYVGGPEREKAGIYLGSLDGGEAQQLVTADSNAVFTPSLSADRQKGFLLFMREGTLLAQPFDAAQRRLTGEPFHIADQVRRMIFWKGAFSVSENGVLVYRSSGSSGQQLGWFDREGKSLGLIGSAGSFFLPKLSPDEKWVAVPRSDSTTKTYDIWLLDVVRGTESRFTFDPATDQAVVWSPDGRQLIWASNRDGEHNLYEKAKSGTGQDTMLLKSDRPKYPNDWSRNGQFILYLQRDPKTALDIWVLPLGGDRQPFPYLNSQFNEIEARFSPDSKWIAYASDETGTYEVYVQPFPPTGSKWPISIKGGNHPRWRLDGKELFYIAADGKMMAVEVKSGASFEAGIPQALFDYRSSKIEGQYAVTGDGQRFLVAASTEETSLAPFTVVLNWTAEVKR
jgi:Tol biopolymer transport system component